MILLPHREARRVGDEREIHKVNEEMINRERREHNRKRFDN